MLGNILDALLSLSDLSARDFWGLMKLIGTVFAVLFAVFALSIIIIVAVHG